MLSAAIKPANRAKPCQTAGTLRSCPDSVSTNSFTAYCVKIEQITAEATAVRMTA
jgi:hypothetical protein